MERRGEFRLCSVDNDFKKGSHNMSSAKRPSNHGLMGNLYTCISQPQKHDTYRGIFLFSFVVRELSSQRIWGELSMLSSIDTSTKRLDFT